LIQDYCIAKTLPHGGEGRNNPMLLLFPQMLILHSRQNPLHMQIVPKCSTVYSKENTHSTISVGFENHPCSQIDLFASRSERR
jgi:hypothetical protein